MRARFLPGRARLGYVTLAVLLAGYAASTLLRPRGWHSTLLDNGVPNAIQIGAAVLCLQRARTVNLLRGAWAAFGAGLLIWSAGDVYWTLKFGNGAPPGPSLADVAYLAFYPLAYVGLVLVIRSRATRFPPALWWDGAIVALGAAAIAAAFGYDAIASVSAGDALTVGINICYPIGDMVLVALAAAMLTLFREHLEIRWILLAASSVVAGIADIVYLIQTAHGSYVEGTYLDALWPAAILAMSFASWLVPGRSRRVGMDGSLMLVAPLAASAAAGGLLIYGNLVSLDPVALALSGAALGAAGIRMALGFHDLHALHQTRVLAHTDELTQLSNRRHFLSRLDAVLAATASDDARTDRLAVLFVDLDRFKEINDAFGHQVGDELLTMLGPRLHRVLRNGDLLARLGGDEFAILLEGGDSDYALAVAERISTALTTPFALSEVSVHVGASIGIALAPEHGHTTHELLRCADIAMYHAKNGHARVAVFDAVVDTSRDRLQLLEDLRTAIHDRQLTLYYQPKIDLKTGRMCGVEALLRWQHPTREAIPPEIFVTLAEEARLMRPLTHFVLDTAIAQCAAWCRSGDPLRVAVNLSANNLLDDDLPAQVKRLLDYYDVSPALLTLEITETTMLLEPGRARPVIAALRATGVALSIDDFGTGYSSLAYLRDLPVDELKLDRSFVQTLAGAACTRDTAIVRSAVTLGQGLGLRVVAEGVEDAVTLALLTELGFDEAQGFYLGRPVPAEQLDLSSRVVAPAGGIAR